MFTMMIPSQLTMIPSYLILTKLHLVNTLWGLIVPSIINAFGIFMMRQFILSIPNELIDAGRIDGTSQWQIYKNFDSPAAWGLAGYLWHADLYEQLERLPMADGGHYQDGSTHTTGYPDLVFNSAFQQPKI